MLDKEDRMLDIEEVFCHSEDEIDWDGGVFVIYVVRDSYMNDEAFSVLRIDEVDFDFILPVIEEFYPYIQERYYLAANHLPSQMWDKILERLRYVRNLILNDPGSEELRPYTAYFPLVLFADPPQKRSTYQEYEEFRERLHREPEGVLRKHGKEIAAFYDRLIDWSEQQMRQYDYDLMMFDVQGP